LVSKENLQIETASKEAVKNFQFAAFIFNKLSNEIEAMHPSVERPTEFQKNYLNFVNFLLKSANKSLFSLCTNSDLHHF
jgi:hypothetical protein